MDIPSLDTIEKVSKLHKWQISSFCCRAFEWEKWANEIPFIKFPSGWEIQSIPPIASAVVRFRAKHKDKVISVYLDCYDQLGCFRQPYWEAYPIDDDNERFAMHDIDGLISAMKKEFSRK